MIDSFQPGFQPGFQAIALPVTTGAGAPAYFVPAQEASIIADDRRRERRRRREREKVRAEAQAVITVAMAARARPSEAHPRGRLAARAHGDGGMTLNLGGQATRPGQTGWRD
jgi:hypothetical protein